MRMNQTMMGLAVYMTTPPNLKMYSIFIIGIKSLQNSIVIMIIFMFSCNKNKHYMDSDLCSEKNDHPSSELL